jgi:hypothetical protein
VRSTTPIEQVSLACQTLWLPYGVTQAPPADELRLERVPNAPTVVNNCQDPVGAPPAWCGR